MRGIFAICCWIVLLFLALTFCPMLIGMALWLPAMAYLVKPFLVSVPEVTGLLTINLLTGTLRPYGTGMHFRFPWEQVKVGNYINLRTITPNQRKESYPSADGPAMIVKWSFQYIPRLELLPRFIAVDQSTIDNGLGDVGSSFLSAEIARRNAIDCKTNQAQLEAGLQSAFEGQFNRGVIGETVEHFYGIDIVRISLADVDYDEKFQRARTSEQVAKRLRDIATAIITEHPDIKPKDAMNTALIINGDVSKNVQEVEGDPLAGLFMAGANAVGGNKKGGK